MIVDVHELEDHEEILAGPQDGALMLSKLIEHVSGIQETMVVILDFRLIQVATSSYLREAVLGFRDYCRNSRPNLYPVVGNLGLKVFGELEFFLKERGDAIVVCETTNRGAIKAARVLGKLEEKQTETLKAVLAARKADAASLAKKFADDGTKATAWHNRLNALCAKGIIMETQDGRLKVYQPVVEELSYGR
jgi:hypothetical protein